MRQGEFSHTLRSQSRRPDSENTERSGKGSGHSAPIEEHAQTLGALLLDLPRLGGQLRDDGTALLREAQARFPQLAQPAGGRSVGGYEKACRLRIDSVETLSLGGAERGARVRACSGSSSPEENEEARASSISACWEAGPGPAKDCTRHRVS